jgi:hypothetical protein
LTRLDQRAQIRIGQAVAPGVVRAKFPEIAPLALSRRVVHQRYERRPHLAEPLDDHRQRSVAQLAAEMQAKIDPQQAHFACAIEDLNHAVRHLLPRLFGQTAAQRDGVERRRDAGAHAMFDEVDEGTAMRKVAATRAETPADVPMVTLDTDGETLPSGWRAKRRSV